MSFVVQAPTQVSVKGWSLYDARATNAGRTGIFNVASVVNRFHARYKFARSFKAIQLDGYSDATVNGYSALMRASLHWTAFELFKQALHIKDTRDLIDHYPFDDHLTTIRGCISNKPFFNVIRGHLLDPKQKSQIEAFADGAKVSPLILGKALRHIFLHGSPLTLKVIRCVFGDRDRRRLSTYHTVLLAAIADKWAVSDVAKNIFDCGGVQEISLRKPGGMSAKDKANAARAALMNQSIASLSSDALSKQFNKEHVAETAVAVMTLNNDGTYSVHCVVRSATAVNAALAGYFSANKEVLVGLQEQQKAQAAEAEKAQLIANAVAAANDVKTELAA